MPTALSANHKENTKQFLDYVATNSEATIMYQASNMVLAVHSGASYLSNQKHAAEWVGTFSCPGVPFSPQQWRCP